VSEERLKEIWTNTRKVKALYLVLRITHKTSVIRLGRSTFIPQRTRRKWPLSNQWLEHVLRKQTASSFSRTFSFLTRTHLTHTNSLHTLFPGGKLRHARLCSINVRSRNFLSRKLNSPYCRVKQKGAPFVESLWCSRSCSVYYVYTKSWRLLD
jgi:hypothetical protein